MRVFPCRGAPTSLKPGPQNPAGPMSGIIMILVFIAVMAALNFYESARLD